jgi:hypothetical protein
LQLHERETIYDTPVSPEKKFIARPLLANIEINSDDESSDNYGSEESFDRQESAAGHYMNGRLDGSMTD